MCTVYRTVDTFFKKNKHITVYIHIHVYTHNIREPCSIPLVGDDYRGLYYPIYCGLS